MEQATTLIEETTQFNAALSTEIEELKGNLDNTNAKVTELESALESRKEELGVTISELSTELEASKSKIQELTDNIDSKEKLVDAQTARLEEVIYYLILEFQRLICQF
ncbi:unnamed protein product, partial [marine sediment metagenome]